MAHDAACGPEHVNDSVKIIWRIQFFLERILRRTVGGTRSPSAKNTDFTEVHHRSDDKPLVPWLSGRFRHGVICYRMLYCTYVPWQRGGNVVVRTICETRKRDRERERERERFRSLSVRNLCGEKLYRNDATTVAFSTCWSVVLSFSFFILVLFLFASSSSLFSPFSFLANKRVPSCNVQTYKRGTG